MEYKRLGDCVNFVPGEELPMESFFCTETGLYLNIFVYLCTRDKLSNKMLWTRNSLTATT